MTLKTSFQHRLERRALSVSIRKRVVVSGNNTYVSRTPKEAESLCYSGRANSAHFAILRSIDQYSFVFSHQSLYVFHHMGEDIASSTHLSDLNLYLCQIPNYLSENSRQTTKLLCFHF